MIRRAMVLAAGHGTRLRPLTDTCPKPLMRVGDAPLLEHVLAFLRAGGITEVVINLHHLGQQIEARIGDGRRFGLTVHYSRENPILDTGGGIRYAERYLAGEPFVVANGDSLLELPLRDLLDAHRAGGGLVTMALRPTAPGESFAPVETDAAGDVRRIAGLPAGTPSDPSWRALTFPGLHVLEPGVFAFMPAAGAFSITRDTYPRILEAGGRIRGFVTDARWLTIDTPEALRDADALFGARPFECRAAFARAD